MSPPLSSIVVRPPVLVLQLAASLSKATILKIPEPSINHTVSGPCHFDRNHDVGDNFKSTVNVNRSCDNQAVAFLSILHKDVDIMADSPRVSNQRQQRKNSISTSIKTATVLSTVLSSAPTSTKISIASSKTNTMDICLHRPKNSVQLHEYRINAVSCQAIHSAPCYLHLVAFTLSPSTKSHPCLPVENKLCRVINVAIASP